MKSKRGRFAGITRPRDRKGGYGKQAQQSRITHPTNKIGHCYFLKGLSVRVVILSQQNDTVTFNENGPMPLESFNAYFEHRPRECEYCRQNA